MKITCHFPILAAAIFGLLAAPSHAADPIATPYVPSFQSTLGLGSTVFNDQWTGLSITNHPGYPGISGSQIWPSPIAPNSASPRNSIFQKTPGHDDDTTDFLPNSSGGGIYSFFSATSYEIKSSSPLAGLNRIQLQLSIAQGVPSEPILTLSTTSGDVILTEYSFSHISSTDVLIPDFGNQPATINLDAYLWDVSAYSGTITGVTVDWEVEPHSLTYGAQLAQAVPEPSPTLFLAVAGAFAAFHIRHRIRRAG